MTTMTWLPQHFPTLAIFHKILKYISIILAKIETLHPMCKMHKNLENDYKNTRFSPKSQVMAHQTANFPNDKFN